MIWLFFWALLGGLVGLFFESQYTFSFVMGGAVAVLFARLYKLSRRLKAAERLVEEAVDEVRRLAARPVPAPAVSPQPAEAPATVGSPAVAPAHEPVQPPVAEPPAPPADAAAPAPATLRDGGPELEAEALTSPAPVDSSTPTPATTDRLAPITATPDPAPTPAPVRSVPPMPPADPYIPAAQEPSLEQRFWRAIARWFTEGNVPVKIGVLVLFAGVAAALRFAAAEGYFNLPIGWRMSLISLSALAGLGLGWRERMRRPTFALSLQGGSIGVLLLTVFASFRLYSLIPAGPAFAVVVLLVGGAALLSVLQGRMALAVLGFLGGYLAPVLLSTGGGSHVALFSFYAVLNASVLAISWKQHWRLLNLIGFVFTFGIGGLWFFDSYRPALFWSVEPFLILFFLFYVFIGLLYYLRPERGDEGDRRGPWLDSTLIFGTPLVAFPMQAVLLEGQRMALAFSAIAVASIYLGLLVWVRRQKESRLLGDAYAGLAIAFATLAVPLAFSASTTASLWALQGTALVWLGLRQGRLLPRLSGLGLQGLGAAAFAVSEFGGGGSTDVLLLNGTWLGAALLGFAGLASAYLHDKYKPEQPLPAMLMAWGLGWWTLAGLTQLDEAVRHFRGSQWDWIFAVLYLAVGVLGSGVLRSRLDWDRASWGLALWTGLALPCVVWAGVDFDGPLAVDALPGWLAFFCALALALRQNPQGPSRTVAVAHASGLWTAAFAMTAHFGEKVDASGFEFGWIYLAVMAPVALLTLGLWRHPQAFAWPRAEAFEKEYPWFWFAPALPLLGVCWIVGVFGPGDALPLPYVPLFNPLEISLVGLAVLLWGFCRDRLKPLASNVPVWAAMAFVFISMATLRAVAHLVFGGWSGNVVNTGVAQTSLTVVWSLIGVAAWVLGSQSRHRLLWQAGAALMGVVLVKLILIDRTFMGNIAGIVSFLAVGMLLVAVGYFAPSPPRAEEDDDEN
ncbi:MAG: DUF2339 domain-containing protein [Acidobacteriota bacterium]